MKPLHIAALVKQVPDVEDMQLGPDGRLQREGVALSMHPYCLRAVSQGALASYSGLGRNWLGRCMVMSSVCRWLQAASRLRKNCIRGGRSSVCAAPGDRG